MSNNIKKITIDSNSLPPLSATDTSLYYNLRYRVISEDKNRYSHWSQFYQVTVPTTQDEVGFDPLNPILTSIPNSISIDKSAKQIELTWTMPALLLTNPTEEEKILQAKQASISAFDIYVQWKTGNNPETLSEWTWLRSSYTSRFGMTYLAGPDYVRLRVQKITQEKQAWNSATYLVTDWHSL